MQQLMFKSLIKLLILKNKIMSQKNELCQLCKVGTIVEMASHGKTNLICDYCGKTYVQENTGIEVRAGKSNGVQSPAKVERVPNHRSKIAPQRRDHK
jgi:tRNA(Ile2) C34 agmatinyltransferase TiaS